MFPVQSLSNYLPFFTLEKLENELHELMQREIKDEEQAKRFQQLLSIVQAQSNFCDLGKSLMETALSKRNAVAVKFLLQAKIDPNGKTNTDNPFLLLAIQTRDAQIVTLFLDKGADLHVTDKHGCPMISKAVETGSQDIVQVLLNKGANPNALCYNKSLLEIAYEKRDINIIQLLLQNGANPNKHLSNSFNCNTLLISAVHSNEPKVIRLLLQNRADPNMKNRFGCTPLQIALDPKRAIGTDTIVALIDNGALPKWDWNNETCRKVHNFLFKRAEIHLLSKHLKDSLEQNTINAMTASFMNKTLYNICEQKTFEIGVETLFQTSAKHAKSKQQLIHDSEKMLQLAEEHFGKEHTILSFLRSQLSRMY